MNLLLKKYLLITICLLSCIVTTAHADKKFVLVIDAGHGGHDAGAVGAFSKEKNINLKTALAFGKYVEKNCPDVKVVYTRKTDVFVPLHQRADIANKNHANVFISVHTNSLPAGRVARGFETYTMGMRRSDEKLSAAMRENSVITYEEGYQERYEGYDPNSVESLIMFEFMHDKNMAKSVELAQLVQKNVCATAGCQDKGVKQDVFLVLRETSMPACLIELGFISTPDEETKLNNDAYIDKLAYGIYAAFVKYKDSNNAVVAPYQPGGNATEAAPVVNDKEKSKKSDKEKTKKSDDEKAKKTETEKPKKQSNHKRRPETEPTVSVAPQQHPLESQTVKEPVPVVAPAEQNAAPKDEAPVFKVQFMTSDKVLKEGRSEFKGVTGTAYYRVGNLVKYTIGNCATFAEAAALKKTIVDKFPDAFIVAFINGERVDLNVARNYKKQK